jgi:hypothetical protein
VPCCMREYDAHRTGMQRVSHASALSSAHASSTGRYEIAALKSPFYSTSLNFWSLGNKITKAEYEAPPAHFSKTLHGLLSWMIRADPDARPDIGQVLRIAQLACESIAATGAVSDDIPVGADVCAPSTTLPPNHRPSSKQGASTAGAQGMED